MASLLIYGYCRRIEQSFTNQIIPNGIFQLCLQYYLSGSFLFYIYKDVSAQGDILPTHVEIRDLVTKNITKCQDTFNTFTKVTPGCAICYVPQLKMQKHLITQLKLFPNKNTYDTLFLCHAIPKAIFIDIESVSVYQNNTAPAVMCELPAIQGTNLNGHYSVFSANYGLIVIGGYDRTNKIDENKIHILPFKCKNFNEWKWKDIPHMKESRYRPSAALIGRHNNEKLVVFGGSFENEIGDYYSTKVEIFDFEHNKWSLLSDIEYGFDCMGVCYDDCKNDCIYVGGWNSDYEGIIDIDVCKTMRYLDVEKNKWF
eukprot:247932_1